MSQRLLQMMGAMPAGGDNPFTGVLSYYKCDEAVDNPLVDSASTYDLIQTGGGTVEQETVIAMQGTSRGPLNGSGHRFELTDTYFRWDASKYWSGWFYPTDNTRRAVARNGGSGQKIFFVTINNLMKLQLETSISGGGYDYLLADVVDVNNNEFVMLSWGYDAALGEVWVQTNDNGFVTQSLGGNTPYDGVGNMVIARDDGGSAYFKGYIDEIGYYSGVPTQADIDWLYNSGIGRTYTP